MPFLPLAPPWLPLRAAAWRLVAVLPLIVGGIDAAFAADAPPAPAHGAVPAGAVVSAPASLPDTPPLERLFSDPPLPGRLPRQAAISPGGHWVGFLKPSAADSEELELWAQPAAGGAAVRIASSAELLGGAAEHLSEAEKMALQRRRIDQRGITSWQWCGRDDRSVLFPLSGGLYLLRLAAGGGAAHLVAAAADSPKQDPRCSPDGTQVAYVQGGDLWVQAVDGGAPRRLTDDATETRFYGLAEFVAAEELDRQRGYWWSPDGKRLLVLHVDESDVPIKTRAQIYADHTSFTQQRYPAAGEHNAKVDALVIDVDTRRRLPLAQPAGSEYVARAEWFDDGTPWLQVLTRDQTRMTLLEYDPASGEPHRITQETDAAWVAVHDDLAEVKGLALSGKPALLWSSEASGRGQLVLLDRVTGARRAFTSQAETVTALVCTDGRQVVFEGATERGMGRELFVADLGGRTRLLAGAAPHQWRTAEHDRACRRLLVSRSAWGEPPQLALRGVADGEPAVPIAGDPPDPLLAWAVGAPTVAHDGGASVSGRPETPAIVAADGRTPLNAFYFPAFRAGSSAPPVTPASTASAAAPRDPVIVLGYGGPGTQTIGWRWSRDIPMIAWWRHRGYGVFMVDNRGMNQGGRDRDFTRAHFHQFGHVEVDDLFAAVHQLVRQRPEVDPARIGFFGWSYGGTLATRAILDADSPFAASVAVAPVTDWTLYDTAYTERYLGLPTLADGSVSPTYRDANLVQRAGLLTKPYLLMHGTADDNVLFEHSLRLVAALQAQGRLFELQIYPGKAHGIGGRASQLHVYKTMDAFFARTLRPGAGPSVPPVQSAP